MNSELRVSLDLLRPGSGPGQESFAQEVFVAGLCWGQPAGWTCLWKSLPPTPTAASSRSPFLERSGLAHRAFFLERRLESPLMEK